MHLDHCVICTAQTRFSGALHGICMPQSGGNGFSVFRSSLSKPARRLSKVFSAPTARAQVRLPLWLSRNRRPFRPVDRRRHFPARFTWHFAAASEITVAAGITGMVNMSGRRNTNVGTMMLTFVLHFRKANGTILSQVHRSQKHGAILGSCQGPSGAAWGNLGANLRLSRPSGGHFGPLRVFLEPCRGNPGAF